jgi:hypothetical protein
MNEETSVLIRTGRTNTIALAIAWACIAIDLFSDGYPVLGGVTLIGVGLVSLEAVVFSRFIKTSEGKAND